MCGIAGLVSYEPLPEMAGASRAMAESLRHRGPDDEGFWQSPECALGHRRLSILDLSGGVQPMENEDGRVVVVYNGEIYNHHELRAELASLGHRFRTSHSDTETLVHGYEQWGAGLPEKLNGIFAFAVWDDREKELFLARDRYGTKPLYYARATGGAFVFGSEIRALFASGLVPKKERAAGLLEYLSFQNFWCGRTPFEGVMLLEQGSAMTVGRGGSRTRAYWDYSFPRREARPLAEAAEAHRGILKNAIARQIEADVPVMTYLSGGIDSSAIASAAHHLDRRVRAYSCLFDLAGVGADKTADEREFSRAVAAHLSIDHVETTLAQDSVTTALDPTIAALEYPMMGVSYENYLIAGRVAKDAKVVLSGTGGDEIHGGYYYRYMGVPRGLGLRSRLRLLARSILGRPAVDAKAAYRSMLNFPVPEDKLSRALTPEFLAAARDFSPREEMDGMLRRAPGRDPWDMIMYVDARTYLHGLLVLEDKLSMAHSLEARLPLLDNELVDFAVNAPWSLLVDKEMGKVLFRESVRPWVPDSVYRKPKMGFGPPEASWYRGALKGWVLSVLSEDRIRRRGIFRPEFVRGALDRHMSGEQNNLAFIWSLLSLESWFASANVFGGDLAPRQPAAPAPGPKKNRGERPRG